jgi:crossover junction endodeoxyribonuclease RuvC
MKVLGIDPGQTGALAIVELNDGAAPELIFLIDVPMIGTGARERVDVIQIRDWIIAHKPEHAVLERSQALPRQGSSSGHKFGRTAGALEAAVVLSGVP